MNVFTMVFPLTQLLPVATLLSFPLLGADSFVIPSNTALPHLQTHNHKVISSFAPTTTTSAKHTTAKDPSTVFRGDTALSVLPEPIPDLLVQGSAVLSTLPEPIPDLVIPFGPRSLLSLIGIITIVAGVWHVDRTWDEKGSELVKAGKTSPEDLEDAIPFPVAFIVGWVLFGAANLYDAGTTFGGAIDLTNVAAIVAAGSSLVLSVVAGAPMADAVKTRNADAKKKLSLGFVLGWLALTASTILIAKNDIAPILCPAGMVTIIASMKTLWNYRKMGDSWEQDGKPNPNPVVYNLGGPLFVLGWFLFYVGMAATSDVSGWDGFGGLPLYFNARSALALFAGCGMVPVVAALDFAHDEGAEYTGFGTDGRFFGFMETPVPFLLFWALFGASALLPFGGGMTAQQLIIPAICVLQGIDAGLLIQTSLYEGDKEGKDKWSLPFVGLFIALAACIGLDSTMARALAFPGAALIILGQKTVFEDRKRGDYWMETGENNPNPIVYSYGEPLFMFGWIIIALAMSLPMAA